jgi:hypothetical protein
VGRSLCAVTCGVALYATLAALDLPAGVMGCTGQGVAWPMASFHHQKSRPTRMQ